MIESLVDLLRETFPSISPYTADRCLRLLKQQHYEPKDLYEVGSAEGLSQGDILRDVPTALVASDGRGRLARGVGMLLSATCDLAHDEQVLVAPCFPMSGFATHPARSDIVKNRITTLIYLPQVSSCGDFVADLSLLSSVAAELVRPFHAALGEHRICRLSRLGFYMFLAKVTFHLMRPETPDVVRTQSPPGPLSHEA